MRGWIAAVPGLAMLAPLPAAAQPEPQAPQQLRELVRRAQASLEDDGFAYLHGFGEGVAAVLMTATPAQDQRPMQGFNGKVLIGTFRQPGIELQAMDGQGKPFPLSLVISRPGYPLPLDLHIGDARDRVERALLTPQTEGDTVLIPRKRGDGCADPVTFSFRDGRLVQVEWSWEICAVD